MWIAGLVPSEWLLLTRMTKKKRTRTQRDVFRSFCVPLELHKHSVSLVGDLIHLLCSPENPSCNHG